MLFVPTSVFSLLLFDFLLQLFHRRLLLGFQFLMFGRKRRRSRTEEEQDRWGIGRRSSRTEEEEKEKGKEKMNECL